jgi:hypothetical protein
MKTHVTLEEKIILTVEDTNNEEREFAFPLENIHYWYPFNVNFVYQFTAARKFLYLIQEPTTQGVENIYNVDILKRTKPLEKKDGVMFHPEVFKRNFETIGVASILGIKTIDQSFTAEDVREGFNTIGKLIETAISIDAGDTALQRFGEIYSMLTLMRKIVEGR